MVMNEGFSVNPWNASSLVSPAPRKLSVSFKAAINASCAGVLGILLRESMAIRYTLLLEWLCVGACLASTDTFLAQFRLTNVGCIFLFISRKVVSRFLDLMILFND